MRSKQVGGRNSINVQCCGDANINGIEYTSKNTLILNGEEIKNAPSPLFGSTSMVTIGKATYINGKKYNHKTKTFKWSFVGIINHLF